MLEKLYKMVDGQVLTEDVKTSIEEAFNNAVEAKAGLLVESKINETQTAMRDELQEKIAELNEAANEYRKEVDEQFKKKLEDVNNKAEQYIDNKLAETEHNLDNYTKFLATKLVENSRTTNEHIVKDLKSEAMFEALRRFAKIAGRDLSADLDEGRATLVSEHLEEVNKLIEENNSLHQRNIELQNRLIFEDVTKDLSISQKDRMARASQALIDCDDPDIRTKFTALKESFDTVQYRDGGKRGDTLNYDTMKKKPHRGVADMLFKNI